MYNPLKTRRGRLEQNIQNELSKENPNLEVIVSCIEDYQKDNIKTITKLKRTKKIDMSRINGALKQSINAHGPITKELIGSAGKRIYGSLLDKSKKPFRVISIRDILIGIGISLIFFLVLFAI